MSSIAKIQTSAFAYLDFNNGYDNVHAGQSIAIADYDKLCFQFEELPIVLKFKRIISAALWCYLLGVENNDTTSAYAKIFRIQHLFDPETITYQADSGAIDYKGYYYLKPARVNDMPVWVRNNASELNTGAIRLWQYGFALGDLQPGAWDSKYSRLKIQTSGANRPYLEIEYDPSVDASPTVGELSPDSGAIAKTEANIFTWSVGSDFPCLPTIAQTSAVFRWRSGPSGTVHTISVSGSAQSVTVPANIFAGTTSIQWQVAVTANSGVTTTSDWVTLSTADATPTAAPLSPVDTVIDGSKDTLFQWQHTISTGTAQSKADLQKSTDGLTWSALATVTGSARQWTCPAGTLTSSIKYWRVRTYNADGVAGEWSEAAQIVVIAAPTAPSIQIKSTGPRPSISWQSSEQEAYQVELDGALSGGTHYGTEKSWTSPAYLADGSHTVRVRVQNQYGMWSDWGAAALPVTNTPGAAITLNVEASSVAELSWQTTGSYDFYLVYRDGKPIAKLAQTQYTDELSSGSVSYQVRGCYDDSGNYGLSSAVTVTVFTGQYAYLYGIVSGKRAVLKHCGLKNQPIQDAISRNIQYIFMYGSTYPHAERSEFVTRKVGGTAVFLPGEDKETFDALIGELVCLKTQTGDMVIGYLNDTSDTSRPNPNKSVVNFSIQQIDYKEVIDIAS